MRKSVVRRNWEDLLCGKYEQKLLSGKNVKIWFSFTHTAVPAGAVGQFLNQKVAKKKMHTNGVQQYRGWTNKQTDPSSHSLHCRGTPHKKRLLYCQNLHKCDEKTMMCAERGMSKYCHQPAQPSLVLAGSYIESTTWPAFIYDRVPLLLTDIGFSPLCIFICLLKSLAQEDA